MIALIIALIIYLFAALPLLKIIQLKDYFFPSIWAHFDLPSNLSIFFKKSEIVLGLIWVVLLALLLFGLNLQFPTIRILSLVLILILLALLVKRKEFLQTFNWTAKFLFINILLLLFVFRIIQYSDISILIIIFLLTKLGQFPIVISATFIANFLTKIYAGFLYKKARKKIKEWKNSASACVSPAKIIGITGSYGKSTTKELLAQLLSAKYNVLKSPLRLNAEIGLAQFVLKSNLEKIDFLVIEMGARAIGEIKTLVDIFEPDIAYLTGIAPQHIATFGSLEKIIKAKLEIFGKQKKPSTAILNGNDELLPEIFEGLNISSKYLYGKNGVFYSKNENYSLEGTNFVFVHPDGVINLETNLIAPHQLENLIGALAGCYLLNIKPQELTIQLKNLKTLPHSFEITQKVNPLIIDDSYNANLIGVQKGAEYFLDADLGKISTQLNTDKSMYKIIIFAGILELGPETPNYYKGLIETLKKADKVFLTFTDFAEIFLENLGTQTEVINREKFEKFYAELPKDNSGILILGRVPNWVFEIIKKQSI
jgi:UDP-N-acetylmuramoyl-tripeptide--D-alanyl-D-alanine ligase